MNNFYSVHKKIFFILSSILILILFYGDSRHDYSFYTLTWESFANNKDVVVYNVYGPIHLLLSYVYKIHYLAPKIIFAFSFIYLSYLVFKRIIIKKKNILLFYFYLTLHCNFLIISGVFFYGLNDTFVAFFFIFSILFYVNQRFIFSGIFISIASLIKLYPILFIPQLLITNNKINFKIFFTIVVFIFLFLTLFSFLFDYKLLLEPLSFGSNRGPKFASIIASLNYSFPDNKIVAILIKYNSYILIVSILFVYIFTYIKKTELFFSIIFLNIFILTIYKVGHTQYYIPLMVLSSLLLTFEKRYLQIFKILFPLILLLSITTLGYSLTGGYDLAKKNSFPWILIRENIGYIYFLINVSVLIRMSLLLKNFKKNTIEY